MAKIDVFSVAVSDGDDIKVNVFPYGTSATQFFNDEVARLREKYKDEVYAAIEKNKNLTILRYDSGKRVLVRIDSYEIEKRICGD